MDYTGGDIDSTFNVYVFGDQTDSFESDLVHLLHVKGCEVLSSFFEQTQYALRLEISRLPISQQELFPQFTSIIDLLTRKSDHGSNPALELALLSLCQLARFIKYVSPIYSRLQCSLHTSDTMATGQDHFQALWIRRSLAFVRVPLQLLP